MKRAGEVGPAVELNDLLACDEFDVMDQIHEIDLPTHVMCGSENVITPVSYSDDLARKITNATEEVIPGGSHHVQLEKYHEVNQQIDGFLARLKKL